MEEKKQVFDVLFTINVNEKTEKKDRLTYLPWVDAWAIVKNKYPDANYRICWVEGKPYFYDENLGYMVFTEVTINNETIPMHLPVMDGKNKSMKKDTYSYKTKYGDKSVDAATMNDINKTIMRCLTKNLAMFGLGLYIYAKEDLPEISAEEQAKIDAEKIAEEQEKTDAQIQKAESVKAAKESIKNCNALAELTTVFNSLDSDVQIAVKKEATKRKLELTTK